MTRRRGARSGFAIVDALVAATLAAIALTGLVASAGLAARQLRHVRRASLATSLAVDALEQLRPGPYARGADRRWRDGLVFERVWSASDGRGRPTTLDAEVRSGTHRSTLSTAVTP